MSDAVVVAVAKAVTAQIAAATLSQKFTPERSYADWDFKLEAMDLLALQDADKLHVDVVGHTMQQASELATRGSLRYTVPIDIAVRRKFGQDKQNDDTGRIAIEEIDALMLLTQELFVMFTKVRLADFQYAIWDNDKGGTNIVVAPDVKHLRELRQFTAIIRIFFRADIPLNV